MTDWWAFTLFAVMVVGAGLTSIVTSLLTEWGKSK